MITTIAPELQERFVTPDELAKLLGVDRQTVYKWKERGPKRLRAGGAIRYRESDVIAWLEECQERWGN